MDVERKERQKEGERSFPRSLSFFHKRVPSKHIVVKVTSIQAKYIGSLTSKVCVFFPLACSVKQVFDTSCNCYKQSWRDSSVGRVSECPTERPKDQYWRGFESPVRQEIFFPNWNYGDRAAFINISCAYKKRKKEKTKKKRKKKKKEKTHSRSHNTVWLHEKTAHKGMGGAAPAASRNDDVGLHVLGCRVDILGTNCKSFSYCSFTQVRRSKLPGKEEWSTTYKYIYIYIY